LSSFKPSTPSLNVTPADCYWFQFQVFVTSHSRTTIASEIDSSRWHGYRRLHVLFEREGEQINHKRVYRIYCEAKLALRRKKRKYCMRMRR